LDCGTGGNAFVWFIRICSIPIARSFQALYAFPQDLNLPIEGVIHFASYFEYFAAVRLHGLRPCFYIPQPLGL
jgi:hypothetical protein